MDKRLKMALVGAPLLVGGYFIYKQMRGKKTYDDAVNEGDCCKMNPVPSTCTGCNVTPQKEDAVAVGYQKYVVDTLVSNLNVRSNPSLTASVVGTLPKGSEIFAKPSIQDGWFEVSNDGIVIIGYSSSSFLKKVV